MNWIAKNGLIVTEIPTNCYRELAVYIEKYADQNIDIADAALVWLANQIGEKSILTVDKTDFQIYRLKGDSFFELIQWYE